MVLYGCALVLGAYVMVALFTKKKEVVGRAPMDVGQNLLMASVSAPAVVEKRVPFPGAQNVDLGNMSKGKLGADLESKSKVEASVKPDDSASWYSTKIRRPLPESFRRSTRGTEQFCLRDIDPIFRDR